MKVLLNQNECHVAENTTVLTLLTENQLAQSGVAVAVNNQLIPQSDWSEYRLNPEDNLSVFQAIAGG